VADDFWKGLDEGERPAPPPKSGTVVPVTGDDFWSGLEGGAPADAAPAARSVPQVPNTLDGETIPQRAPVEDDRNIAFDIGDRLRPITGGRNVAREVYDDFIGPMTEDYSPERAAELSKRGALERVLDTLSFAGSAPVRMFTQGKHGLGDLVGAVAPKTGESINEAESDFVSANREYLEPLAKAGEGLAFMPPATTMPVTRVPRTPPTRQPPKLPPEKVADAIPKANELGFQAPSQKFARPTNDALIARQELKADFEGSGVTPFGPAFAGRGLQAYAKTAGEQPFVGGPIYNAARNTFSQAQDEASKLANRYGPATNLEEVGRTVDAGIERFKDARVVRIDDNTPDNVLSAIAANPTSRTSLKTKQDALYERAWRKLPEQFRGGRAEKEKSRFMSRMSNTRNYVRQIATEARKLTGDAKNGSFDRTNPTNIASGQLGRMLDNIASPNSTMALQTLRNARSEVRRLASGMANTEKNTLSKSQLVGIQRAITDDMVEVLERNAAQYAKDGDTATAANIRRSIQEFRQADQFTAGSMKRLEAIEKLFRAKTPEQLSDRIRAAARGRGKGDIEMLRTLRKTLTPEEMDDVAAGVLRTMGEPTGSNARGVTGELGFSVSTFTTNWRNMTPEARQTLFSSRATPGLHADLDRLTRVLQALADYESVANTSRTTTNAISGAIVGGSALGAMSMPVTTMSTLLGARLMSSAMTSQAFVRWMTRAAELERRYVETPSPRVASQVQKHWSGLKNVSSFDPELQAEISRLLAVGAGYTTEDQN
jgi:hypothetical protein